MLLSLQAVKVQQMMEHIHQSPSGSGGELLWVLPHAAAGWGYTHVVSCALCMAPCNCCRHTHSEMCAVSRLNLLLAVDLSFPVPYILLHS